MVYQVEGRKMEEEQINIENYKDEENIQLAENENIDTYEEFESYTEKRELLDKTKITKQTWSIIEIFQKIKENKLILEPEYQRNDIWDFCKKTAFIESLYMGIIIPPIYVVEVPGEDILSGHIYEVVDGKQRLSTIQQFINNEFKLKAKNLEYYADIFGDKKFVELREKYQQDTTEMLSSVLDVYVITANSPEFTKYDIFSRLNKGSEKLKVNEIRKAIYRSYLTRTINDFISNNQDKEEYKNVFSKNDTKRYEDYGRFYRSVAFYVRSNIECGIVEKYNSRPREMINNVLQGFQSHKETLEIEKIQEILDKTLKLLTLLKEVGNKEYIIDACIPFVVENWDILLERLDIIKNDIEINETFVKSPATTVNVNKRLEKVKEILL